ncbi:MAG TPA: hypothetical protein VE077_10395 [Candidatus Methylomirabilis sp.]|nr:hypothetical protein [Candidatus Methylomirabilis sp.]
MSPSLKRCAIPLLRWTIAAVVILESARFVLSASAGHFLARMGLPVWVRPSLGISEMIAAILFLVPKTMAAGGYLLLVVFGLAALVHVLHGQFGIEGLMVYAAAVFVCVTQSDGRTAEAPNE